MELFCISEKELNIMVSSKDVLNNDDHSALGLVVYAIFSEFTDKKGDRSSVRDNHFAYLAKLENEGKLFAAGPMLTESGERLGKGLILVKADTLEEAKALADSDPYHKSGFRKYSINPWKINEGGFDLKIRFSAGAYEIE